MNNKIRVVLMLLGIQYLVTNSLKAQVVSQPDLSKITLNRLYLSSFDRVLDDISNEFHLTFLFDRERLAKCEIDDRPFDEPLSTFLNRHCKRNKLKFQVDEDGKIYIMDADKSIDFIKQITTGKINSYTPTQFNITISGIVRDASNGEALPFATISAKVGTKVATSANADGYFVLMEVPSDTTTIVVSYMGYRKFEFKLNPKITYTQLEFELFPIERELQEVTIDGNKEEIMKVSGQDISTIRISPQKISELPSLGEKDIMRSFQLMPGVSSSNESSSGLYVRGGTPDQNLVLYDGFTIYQVDHLYGFFSAFNSNAIKDVQLYKGGFESKFGGRLSSVTEITGKDGNRKQFNAGAELSLLSANAYIEGPVGEKFTYILAGRRSYKGPLYNKIFDAFNTEQQSQQPTPPSGGLPQGENTVTSYFYDLNGKFTYRPTEKDVISLSLFKGTDNLDNGTKIENTALGGGTTNLNLNIDISDLTEYGNNGASLRWGRLWKHKIYSNTLISYSNYFSNRDRSNQISSTDANGNSRDFRMGTIEKNNLIDISFKNDITLNLNKSNNLQFGLFGSAFNIDYQYSQNDTSSILDKNTNGDILGIYVQDKLMSLNSRMVVTPGVRVNYFSETRKVYFEPRINLTYNLTEALKIQAASGIFYQFANRIIREDIISGSKDFWLLSDGSNIPVSSSTHYILGSSYESRDYLFSAEGYFKSIHNTTEYSLRFNASPNGISYDENFMTGNGYAQGIEFLAQRKTGKLSGWISYTLSQAKNKYDAYGQHYYAANQDVTNEFKIVAIYKWKRFDFSTTWVYATGRPYTAPQGAYSVTLLDGSTSEYYTVSEKNTLRLPDYHKLDVAINYRLFNQSNTDIGYIGISLFNLYNRKNVWYKEYQIQESQIVEISHHYLGITPNITLSLKIR